MNDFHYAIRITLMATKALGKNVEHVKCFEAQKNTKDVQNPELILQCA